MQILYLILISIFVSLASGTDTLAMDSTQTIIANALWQTRITRTYDPSYYAIPYPNGDIPFERGVCCDVIVRAFRGVGIDLQERIHLDMQKNFASYPAKWGLRKPDSNIDHRRVPNIATYLRRQGKSIEITHNGKDYLPGDIVTWKLPGGLDHIGLVTDVPVEGSDRYGVVHNIGMGTKLEDILFQFEITGHFRYFPNYSLKSHSNRSFGQKRQTEFLIRTPVEIPCENARTDVIS